LNYQGILDSWNNWRDYFLFRKIPKAGIANASHCLPNPLALPKAFQKQTSFAFGFFAPRLFTKARFRHSLETKKPLTL
jgi:hypothetical protein